MTANLATRGLGRTNRLVTAGLGNFTAAIVTDPLSDGGGGGKKDPWRHYGGLSDLREALDKAKREREAAIHEAAAPRAPQAAPRPKIKTTQRPIQVSAPVLPEIIPANTRAIDLRIAEIERMIEEEETITLLLMS